MVVNEKNCGENLYQVTIGTGLAWTKEFGVYADNEQDAVDLVADYIEEREMEGLYSDYYELADLCDNGQTADGYAEANGLTCCGNSGIYLQIASIKKKYAPKSNKNPIRSKALFQLRVLQDMCIRLTKEETDYLFSLKSETAIENYCHRIIMERL